MKKGFSSGIESSRGYKRSSR